MSTDASGAAAAFAATPSPPYVAVIFTSRRAAARAGAADGETGAGTHQYDDTADAMERLALAQPGYLGIESARSAEGFGITVSYWATETDARAWKAVAEHADAQRRGRLEWYERYEVRVATVTRDYGHP
jgi:heme-degrading monooxygenase HmoA